MEQDEYDKIPDTLKVREFKAGGKIMVTTFLCPNEAPKAMLKVLYRSRWNVELDIRNIKTTRDGDPALQDPGDGDERTLGLSAGLQSDPATDGTGCATGGPDPATTKLQTHGADLDRLAAT